MTTLQKPRDNNRGFVVLSSHDAANDDERGNEASNSCGETKMQVVLEIPELAGKRNLRIPEAATVLGLGRSKVYELIASGRLKSVKLDNARRIPVWAVAEFLDQHNGSGSI